MRVVLQVISEPGAGRKMWLRSGQMLEVGRSEQADVALTHDASLADFHFAIQCDQSLCRLRDLGTPTGTYLNGERVAEAVLENGDRVVAGHTTFAVEIEGATIPPKPAAASPRAQASPRPAPAPARAKPRLAPVAGNTFAFGRWQFRGVPDGWQPLGKHGLRLSQPRRFTHSILIVENPLEDDCSFSDHVAERVRQIPEHLQGAQVEGPRAAEVSGAQEAAELLIRHPPLPSLALVQRQVLAQFAQTIGTITLTTSVAEFEELNPVFDQILAGLALQTDDQARDAVG